MDAQGRHVLAAALTADADILLTDNARHWMAARHIELLTSAQLLTASPASRSRRECIESSSRMSEVCRIRRALSGGDRTLTSPFHQLPCISGGPCISTGRQLQSWNSREMSE
jgi:hypothetical protein